MNKSFLIESLEDYDASLSLLNEKKFSRSLYFFQQSVEKAFKYICLEIGAIEYCNTKQVSHDVFKLMNKLCKYFFKMANRPELNSIVIAVENDLNILNNIKDETEKVIAACETIKTFSCSPPIFVKKEGESYTAAFHRVTSSFGLNLNETDYKAIEDLEQSNKCYVKKSMEDLITFFNLGIKLLTLISSYSIYTNHFKTDDLRYPSPAIYNPSSYFNEDNIFIRALPMMLDTYYRFVLVHLDEVNWGLFKEE